MVFHLRYEGKITSDTEGINLCRKRHEFVNSKQNMVQNVRL